MKTNLALLSLFLVAFTLMALANYAFDGNLRAVQAGKAKLVCFMKDGERVIDPKMVVDFIDDTWVFKNGSAKRCRVIK